MWAIEKRLLEEVMVAEKIVEVGIFIQKDGEYNGQR
jgi:hypothetical protein